MEYVKLYAIRKCKASISKFFLVTFMGTICFGKSVSRICRFCDKIEKLKNHVFGHVRWYLTSGPHYSFYELNTQKEVLLDQKTILLNAKIFIETDKKKFR